MHKLKQWSLTWKWLYKRRILKYIKTCIKNEDIVGLCFCHKVMCQDYGYFGKLGDLAGKRNELLLTYDTQGKPVLGKTGYWFPINQMKCTIEEWWAPRIEYIKNL